MFNLCIVVRKVLSFMYGKFYFSDRFPLMSGLQNCPHLYAPCDKTPVCHTVNTIQTFAQNQRKISEEKLQLLFS